MDSCLLTHCPLSNFYFQKKISIRKGGLSLVCTVMALVCKAELGPEHTQVFIEWIHYCISELHAFQGI